jgi:unsaturated rhamnogalacturonyl hydrolase
MRKLTLDPTRSLTAALGALTAALVFALIIPACGSGGSSPGQNGTGGSSGTGGAIGSGGSGTGGDNGSGGAGTGGTVVEPDASPGDVPPTPDASDTAAEAKPDAVTNPGLNPMVVQMMRKVADWQLQSIGGSKDWIHGAFWAGLMATYNATKDEKYMTAMKNWAGAGWGLDGGAGARGDSQCAAQSMFDAYLADPTPANMARLMGGKPSFDGLVANTPTGSNEWWWEDALFMVPPGFARLGAATGNKQYFATMNTLYWSSYNFLADKASGLVWRDHRGNDRVMWARGNGWVIAGAARVLDYLPMDDPKRADFQNVIKTMAGALAKVQNADGLWRSNLSNPGQFPNPETSGSGFFTFGIAWGVNHGVLDKATYQPIAQKGWDGLVSHVAANGLLGYVQAVGGGPGPASATSTAPYGTGAFLLAGSEIAKLVP